MKKPTVAEIAAKYDVRKPRLCCICILKPDVLELARALRSKHNLSYQRIAKALFGEFGIKVSDGSLVHHFATHEAA